jgi:hypothetical protein
MNHISPWIAGACLLLCACAGSAGPDGDANTAGGSPGTELPASGGGNSNSGGAVDQGGAFNPGAAGSATAGMDAGGSLIDSGGASENGGASQSGGSGSQAGGAGANAGGQGGGTPMPIDYSIWQLQLPTGSGTSPTTIPPSQLLMGYKDAYFYPSTTDDGQMFMDPPTGITTSGSTRCRTELRESEPNGKAAAWHATGTNTMTVTGKVVKGSGVTVAQVFDGGGGNTLCELQYTGGGFSVFYEENKGAGGSTKLSGSFPANTKYTFILSLSAGVLTVTINGKQLYSHTPSSGTQASTFYFKVGNYDQGTSAGPISTTAHSIVEDYTVDVVHK